MKTRDISVGAFVAIEANGQTHQLYIRAIEDGRVTFRRSMKAQRGGWWLPVEYVRVHGELIRPGEAGARPGERRKDEDPNPELEAEANEKEKR